MALTVGSPFGEADTPWTYTGLTLIWDTTTISGVSLSDDRLTVTNTAAGFPVFMGVEGLVNAAQSGGKYYFEQTWVLAGGTGTAGGMCIAPTGTSFDELTLTTNCAGGIFVGGDGTVLAYGNDPSISLMNDSTHDGNIFGFAVDLDNRLFWAKIVGGPSLALGTGWNGSGSNDPATLVGGISIGGGFINPFLTYANDSQIADNIVTANFGGALAGTPFAIGTAGFAALGNYDFWPVP